MVMCTLRMALKRLIWRWISRSLRWVGIWFSELKLSMSVVVRSVKDSSQISVFLGTSYLRVTTFDSEIEFFTVCKFTVKRPGSIPDGKGYIEFVKSSYSVQSDQTHAKVRLRRRGSYGRIKKTEIFTRDLSGETIEILVQLKTLNYSFSWGGPWLLLQF